jgi:ElaB/YqjD/DUF883 family membrane-anchored ribosome-binding protein
MELYFKELISEDASLDKLVDDLLLVVQGADEFAQAAGVHLSAGPKEELTSRLQHLKEGCHRVRKQAIAGALAAQETMRQYPYSSAGFAFAFGLLVGALFKRRR